MSILSDDMRNLERATVSDTATFIASGAGVGLSPWAPGTMGSLLGVLMLWPIENLPLALCWVVWMLVAVMGGDRPPSDCYRRGGRRLARHSRARIPAGNPHAVCERDAGVSAPLQGL